MSKLADGDSTATIRYIYLVIGGYAADALIGSANIPFTFRVIWANF